MSVCVCQVYRAVVANITYIVNNISPSEYLPSESFKLYHNYYPSNFNHKPSNFSKKYNSLSSESVILPDLNTLSLSTNLMTRYLTSMGKIKSKRQTGLSWKQQRKLGKAVRRGRQSGLLSTFAIGSNKKM